MMLHRRRFLTSCLAAVPAVGLAKTAKAAPARPRGVLMNSIVCGNTAFRQALAESIYIHGCRFTDLKGAIEVPDGISIENCYFTALPGKKAQLLFGKDGLFNYNVCEGVTVCFRTASPVVNSIFA